MGDAAIIPTDRQPGWSRVAGRWRRSVVTFASGVVALCQLTPGASGTHLLRMEVQGDGGAPLPRGARPTRCCGGGARGGGALGGVGHEVGGVDGQAKACARFRGEPVAVGKFVALVDPRSGGARPGVRPGDPADRVRAGGTPGARAMLTTWASCGLSVWCATSGRRIVGSGS
jgi:hypothetical protein